MALGTYTELLASLAGWINRDDLTARIPDFVALAEAQMNRRLRARQMVTRTEAALSAEFTDGPTDLMEPIRLTLEISESDIRDLTYLAPERLLAEKAGMGAVTAAEPEFYSLVGTQIQLLPQPGQSYTSEFTYYAKIPALVTNATNWLLTLAPDAYLYGSLVQAAPYLMDDERVVTWGQLYVAAIEEMNRSSRVPGGKLRTDVALQGPRRFNINTGV